MQRCGILRYSTSFLICLKRNEKAKEKMFVVIKNNLIVIFFKIAQSEGRSFGQKYLQSLEKSSMLLYKWENLFEKPTLEGGEIMSLEAMKKITEAEQDTQSRRAGAAAEAKKLVSDAEKAGRALVEQARAQAEAQAKEAMAQAESRAARRTEEILAEKRSDCDALRSAARERLPAAVELIVGRVVSI